MAGLDFPPNPEDGELWLPSDIIHEITSGNVKPPNNTLLPPHPTPPTPPPPLAPNFEIHFGSFVTKTNEDGSAFLSLHCGPDQLVSIYSPFSPTKVLQSFGEKREKVCVLKHGGTGVFLPRSVNTNAAAAAETSEKAVKEIDGGTGSSAFFTHHPNKKKKKILIEGKLNGVGGGKNEWSLETSNNQKIKNAKKEKSQVQHPSGICLPKDWTY